VLEAFNQGGNVVIRVSDDGAGIDPAKVKRKALEKGLLTQEQAAALNDREARNLVFLYGFSTSP